MLYGLNSYSVLFRNLIFYMLIKYYQIIGQRHFITLPHYVHGLVCEFIYIPGKSGLGGFPPAPTAAPENKSVACQKAGD